MSKLIFMLDIETLDNQANGVVTQIGICAADALDLDTIIWEHEWTLPIQPQLDLGMTVSASTLMFWMKQSDEARAFMQDCDGDSFELESYLRAFCNGIARVSAHYIAGDRPVEFWSRGMDFDFPILGRLLQNLQFNIPWPYHAKSDLRCMMRELGISTSDVPRDSTTIAHNALSDAKYQLKCYGAVQKQLATGRSA